MRTSRTALVALITALPLAACGGVGGGGGGGEGGGSGFTTMGFGLPDEIATVRVEQARERTGLDVEVVEGGFDEQQFLSAVAADDPPDAVYLDRATLGTYAARGAIQPLDDCLAALDVDLSQYREAALQQVTYDGQLYGVPEFNVVAVVQASQPVLDEAGVTIEQVASPDWAQIEAAHQAMTAVEGGSISRIGYDPKLPGFLPLWAEAAGVQLLSEDGLTANLDDPAVVEAVAFQKRLVDQAGGWAAWQAFKESWDFFGSENQFASGQLGAMPMEAWYINSLADTNPDIDLATAPFVGRDGQPLAYATGSAWAVPDGVEDLEASCEFVAAMTDSETWVAAATARAEAVRSEGGQYTGTYTGNSVADEEIFSSIYEPVENPALAQAVETVLAVQDSAVVLPASPAGAEFRTAYEDAVVRAMEGSQTPEAAMAQAQAEAQEALDRAAEG